MWLRPLTWMQGGLVALIVVTVIATGHDPWRDRDVLRLALYWGPVPVLLIGIWWTRQWWFHRFWTQNPQIQEPYQGIASEAGIERNGQHSHESLPWDMMRRVQMTDSVVLISSPMQFYPFPRSFFASEDDWVRFRALVQRKLLVGGEGGSISAGQGRRG